MRHIGSRESSAESRRGEGKEREDRPEDVAVAVPELVERIEIEDRWASEQGDNVSPACPKPLHANGRRRRGGRENGSSRMKTEVPFAMGTAVICLPSRVLVMGSESGSRSSLPAIRIVDGTGAWRRIVSRMTASR
jgi:hypothetical protein